MRQILCAAVIATAIASGIGCSSSEQEVAATPAFSPPPGTYTSSQEVTLSCTTPSAVIHYTIDGSLPASSSPTYTSPISVASTTTIQAIAVASGFVTSGIATGTYTIQLPGQAATPTFSPGPGTYTSPQSVTLDCTTANATIYYTVDGSVPTSASAVYVGAIAVSSTMTIKAIAVASGFAESGIASGVYTITPPGPVATPSFTPAPGTYPSPQSVTLTCATAGATIHYTTDGSEPTTASQAYTGPITVSATTTIKALAAKTGLTTSEVASGTFTISTATPAATPTFSPPPGAYTSQQSVTLSCATPGATIYYTVDGSEPGPGSTVYAGPIALPRTATVKAVAVADGYTSSGTATGSYTINLPDQVATPTFSPPPGTYSSPQSVTLNCATPGATIFYFIVGGGGRWAEPYTTPIDVSRTMTIEVYAIRRWEEPWSDLATATYVIGGS